MKRAAQESTLTMLLVCLTTVSAAVPSIAASPLESCRRANDEFLFDEVVGVCPAALPDASLKEADRLEVMGIIGNAWLSLGDEEKACRFWYTQILVRDLTYRFPDSVSPVFHQALERCGRRFAKEGAVAIRHIPPSVDDFAKQTDRRVPLSFVVTDRFARVQSAHIVGRYVLGGVPEEDFRVPLRLQGNIVDGTATYAVELPPPSGSREKQAAGLSLTYDVDLRSPLDVEVDAKPPFSPVALTFVDERPYTACVGEQCQQTPEEESDGSIGLVVPLSVVGGGAAALVVVAGVVTVVSGTLACVYLKGCVPANPTSSSVRIEVAK